MSKLFVGIVAVFYAEICSLVILFIAHEATENNKIMVFINSFIS